MGKLVMIYGCREIRVSGKVIYICIYLFNKIFVSIFFIIVLCKVLEIGKISRDGVYFFIREVKFIISYFLDIV